MWDWGSFIVGALTGLGAMWVCVVVALSQKEARHPWDRDRREW